VIPARQFYNALTAEVVSNEGKPQSELHCDVWRYYRALVADPRRRAFHRYNWVRRTAPLVQLLEGLPRREAPWRLLDAGCGVGTESIFCSVLRDDVDVTGVDISSRRLAVARARLAAYERRIRRPLRARFLARDVFDVLRSDEFDIIWIMEAISHIDPAEQFLVAAHQSLAQAGHLVISDSHALNPAMAWRVVRLRGQGVPEHAHRTTASGQRVPYAQERLLCVGQLAKMLKRSGYGPVCTQLSVSFPPVLARVSWLFDVCVWGDRVLDRIPGVRHLGAVYTIVAARQGMRALRCRTELRANS
jgi:2-polyprenyl-3-methyl-5-hydroxy-6-metoxy-1,4-benzoquinol methylase